MIRYNKLTSISTIPAQRNMDLEIVNRALSGVFVRVSLSSVALLSTGTHRGVPFRLNFAWRVWCLPAGMALLQIILYLPPVIEINKAKKVALPRSEKKIRRKDFFEEAFCVKSACVTCQKHRKCSFIYDNGTQMVNLHEIMARLLI